MENILTAQDLKTKGAQILQKMTKKFDEVFITVRGKSALVVLSMESYQALRDCELEAALYESKKALAEGDYKVQTIQQHIAEVKEWLQ